MNWDLFLKEESKKEYYKKLMDFVNDEYKNNVCHPDYDNIFNAYKYTEYDKVKVVILGQDPYHNYGEAHGLSFSVENGTVTPSLKNIYKEMSDDLGVEINQNGNLEYLTHEGVFLLNTVLTVRHNSPNSHQKKGWEILTDNTIKLLNESSNPIVFILWGNSAISKEKLITNPNHLIIKSAHPSPLGAYKGFWKSKPFSKANTYLIEKGIDPINWYKREVNLFNFKDN